MNSASIESRLDRFRAGAAEISIPKLLILLFTVSFLIHGLVVSFFINQPIALDDMFQYDMLARSLKNGNGFRWYSQADVEILSPYYSLFIDLNPLDFPDQGLETAFRAPGYPFFLAFLYLFVPEAGRLILARLAQAALAAMLAPLAALLGHQASLSRKVYTLSALAISIYPILLFYPIGLASENLYIPLGLSSIILIYLSTKSRCLGWAILAGITCGMTMFTRSIFSIFTLLAALWICHFSPRQKKAGLVFLLAAFGICLPWSIRNSLIMRQPAFVESSAGYNLFIGYHPQGDGGFVSQIAILPMSILDDGDRDRYCMQQAIQFIRQDPLEAVRRVWARLVKFLGPEDREFFYFYSNNYVGAISQPWISLVYALLVVPWGFTLFLGVIGIWQKRADSLTQLVILFLVGYGLPHLLIIAEPRFHLAWVPVLIPFSIYGWNSIRKVQMKQILRKQNWTLLILLMLVTFIFVAGFSLNFSRLVSILSVGGNQLHFAY
jgi:hypothetical protein